jgi:hypothetical protein
MDSRGQHLDTSRSSCPAHQSITTNADLASNDERVIAQQTASSVPTGPTDPSINCVRNPAENPELSDPQGIEGELEPILSTGNGVAVTGKR